MQLPVTSAAVKMHSEAGERGLQDQDMAVPFQMLRDGSDPQRAD